jgi:spore coat polysaccharide biosynthesis predicted glycosyltransferase SpsG
VAFICSQLPETLENRLIQENCKVHRILVQAGSSEDARETLEVVRRLETINSEQIVNIEDKNPNYVNHISPSSRVNPWLVVDGYHFGYNYQKQIKASGTFLLCVDDHGYSEKWCCDAILNQNLNAEKHSSYANDIVDSKRLLGAAFCLLREEFLGIERKTKTWVPIQRLLITLGGSDPENATAATLSMLNASVERTLKIRVLAGADNPHVEDLRSFPSQHSIEVVQNAANMPEQYAWADGIISAGGSTCWEWLYFGLPAAVVTIAENQLPIVRALTESHKAALPLGWFNDEAFMRENKRLAKWIENPALVCPQVSTLSLIDGRGGDRIAALFNPKLEIDIITTKESWLLKYVIEFEEYLTDLGHSVKVITKADDLRQGDLLFVLSYWGLLRDEALAKHVHNLVVHESALPKGKGWSPLSWQILEEKNKIPVTLFEAVHKVDAGEVYLQGIISLEGHELIDEIRAHQAKATFELCHEFVERYPDIVTDKKPQSGEESFYRRRGPEDSRLDPNKSLLEQFNLLRVVDNESYPAFFERNDVCYRLKIERI